MGLIWKGYQNFKMVAINLNVNFIALAAACEKGSICMNTLRNPKYFGSDLESYRLNPALFTLTKTDTYKSSYSAMDALQEYNASLNANQRHLTWQCITIMRVLKDTYLPRKKARKLEEFSRYIRCVKKKYWERLAGAGYVQIKEKQGKNISYVVGKVTEVDYDAYMNQVNHAIAAFNAAP